MRRHRKDTDIHNEGPGENWEKERGLSSDKKYLKNI